MDIKAAIEELVKKVTDDKAMQEKFEKDIETLIKTYKADTAQQGE